MGNTQKIPDMRGAQKSARLPRSVEIYPQYTVQREKRSRVRILPIRTKPVLRGEKAWANRRHGQTGTPARDSSWGLYRGHDSPSCQQDPDGVMHVSPWGCLGHIPPGWGRGAGPSQTSNACTCGVLGRFRPRSTDMGRAKAGAIGGNLSGATTVWVLPRPPSLRGVRVPTVGERT